MIYEYGGHGVKVGITSFDNNDSQYWTRGATYVLVRSDSGCFRTPKGERVDLVSVNGMGEVRWVVWPHCIDKDCEPAIAHFALSAVTR